MANRKFTPFPILNTERLTLRQLSWDDQQSIFDLRSDAAINQYLDRAPCKTIEEAQQFIEKINDAFKNNNALYWAINLNSTNTLVGTICLFDFSDEHHRCEIGYELMPLFQGQGIMKEAAQAVITYVFQTLQCKKIVACTHHDNQKSTQLLLQFNFVPSAAKDEENPDLCSYTLEKED